jgi:hypothetical protein
MDRRVKPGGDEEGRCGSFLHRFQSNSRIALHTIRTADCASRHYFTPSNSTSNISVAFGGMTPPAPRAP